MDTFLKTCGMEIVGEGRRPVRLRGVNLGGWLMMEAYLLHAPNRPERLFRKNFANALGAGALKSFDDVFRRNFIREEDIRDIARLGFNCVRVPFHYRLVERSAYRYDPAGLRFLDQVIRWSKKYKIWVILDLHAVPGSQNHDWHSDSAGQADFWKSHAYRRRAVKLWGYLANRYKNETTVAGYDLLNESVVGNAKLLNAFYRDAIREIRASDQNHILFIEGNLWATDCRCLDRFDDGNYALSIHHYLPLDFTFNFVPHLKYPSRIAGACRNRGEIRKHFSGYRAIARAHGVPVFVGEFGVNARNGHAGEDAWLRDTVACFNALGFHWTYWTYKAVKNSEHPDGLLSYTDNPPWVNRAGPLMGWETFPACWRNRKREMARSWRTERFRANTKILKVLKHAVQ